MTRATNLGGARRRKHLAATPFAATPLLPPPEEEEEEEPRAAAFDAGSARASAGKPSPATGAGPCETKPGQKPERERDAAAGAGKATGKSTSPAARGPPADKGKKRRLGPDSRDVGDAERTGAAAGPERPPSEKSKPSSRKLRALKRKSEDLGIVAAVGAEPDVADAPAKTEELREENSVGKGKKRRKPADEGEGRRSGHEGEGLSRRLRRRAEKAAKTTCFGCRASGHSVRDCPKAKDQGIGICYHCGSTEHTTKSCVSSARKGKPFQYAVCFVCKASGHLASSCPENELGLYPNGGCCRFCKGIDHLAKDCKITSQDVGTTVVGKITLAQSAEDDDFHMFAAEKLMAGREEQAAKDAARAARKAAANGCHGRQAAAAGLTTEVRRPMPKPKKKVVKF